MKKAANLPWRSRPIAFRSSAYLSELFYRPVAAWQAGDRLQRGARQPGPPLRSAGTAEGAD
eukprot:444263-Pyramimonas_sp.AAC.1